MGALSFGAPLVLLGLMALPLIWYLLRLTPPRPQTEIFPPLRILERVARTEETPARSPWWLTLLRLLLAALVILALAAPVLNPREAALSGDGPVGIVIDNGWASTPHWDRLVGNAQELIGEAGEAGRPVSLAFTAEGVSDDATPVEAASALERLAASEPRPIPGDRLAAAERMATALAGSPGASLAFLSDGLAAEDDEETARRLSQIGVSESLVFRPALDPVVGLTAAENGTSALVVSGIRAQGVETPVSRIVRVLDPQDRELGRAPMVFAAGESAGQTEFDIPVELRNDVARIEVEGAGLAAAVRLIDDSFQRRRVALVSGEGADLAQPLLSPLYYISRALEPFADLLRADSADLSIAVPRLLEQRPSVVVLADIGVLPEAAQEGLQGFVEDGGVLVRFAGPRLAAAAGEDTLVPVGLRGGERQLGGALSWSEPQTLAPMDAEGPFAGIEVPSDVTVSRQILAEPSAELASRTWASLADGTPIVTAAPLGAGSIVLFHTTAEATWSNLPISGTFVDMLRRIVSLSRSAGGAPDGSLTATLPPLRSLTADGSLTAASPEARPLVLSAGSTPVVTRENPPGLYGTQDGYVALNLLSGDAELRPLGPLDLGAPVQERGYGNEGMTNLTPWLFAAALLLFALDALALLWLNGILQRLGRRLPRTRTAVLPLLVAGSLAGWPGGAEAQLLEPGEAGEASAAMETALEATQTTRLAYVLTGEAAIDEVSRQGLAGLSQFIAAKTALEPGDPMSVDIETDELAFFPILYWPVDAASAMPSEAAISRVDAYMKQGGTVLFDVEDDAMTALSGAVSEGQRRLRDILGDLDVPPLEPVPPDHVLTKAFYIMNDFPGRHTGSELWVEATLRGADAEARPASAGDGVSSIMITSNDFAGAWAVDEGGLFLYPTDSADPSQREFAYRAGVNIVMYILTGNYKADQVHVPALLERLGQ